MKNELQTSDLAFSLKYDDNHAKNYFAKHDDGFWRQLSNWRDHQIARKALKLADNTDSVLDMPCGTGRFWRLLSEDKARTIHAVDYSQNMIDIGLQHRDSQTVKRINAFQGSAFNLPVDDGFVDTVFCIRLLHHIGNPQDRLEILQELARVTRGTVIISLWVDGNYKSWKRKRLEAKRTKRTYQNRFVIPGKQLEQEFKQAGFSVKARLDFLPFISMWRTYVLEKESD